MLNIPRDKSTNIGKDYALEREISKSRWGLECTLRRVGQEYVILELWNRFFQ